MLKCRVLHIRDLRGFTRIGRVFCMMTGYFDEGLSASTIVCGGWIAKDDQWDQIIDQWSARIKYENRKSAKKGFRKLLSRYHAADCASLKDEFEEWDVPRQILLVRRLQDLMFGPESFKKIRHENRPMVFGFAASLKEAREANFGLTEKQLKRYCYNICAGQCLKEIGRVMNEIHSHEKITFLHDQGEYARAALDAFEAVVANKEKGYKQFVTLAPIGWENCIPLQPADMITHDLLRRLSNHLIGKDQVRRSLERIVGNNTPIVAGAITPGGFRQIKDLMVQDGIL